MWVSSCIASRQLLAQRRVIDGAREVELRSEGMRFVRGDLVLAVRADEVAQYLSKTSSGRRGGHNGDERALGQREEEKGRTLIDFRRHYKLR